mmetsp:Transcript_24491/g.27903  ORF Transcript_24491/g.27903 Transcript_24491/m.27903 type:complete len:150 (+) Transcript_24491:79-528(+)
MSPCLNYIVCRVLFFSLSLDVRQVQSFFFTTSHSKLPFKRLSVSSIDSKKFRQCAITMRDRSSSYWFSTGDRVKVVNDVMKNGSSLNGRAGIVIESWEKCEVDPTCCCAEQVDRDLAVRVEFSGTEKSSTDKGCFQFYFNEDELRKLKD